jgi:zinc transport system ATP-binding protein
MITMANLISIKDLSLKRDNKFILKNISLNVNKADVLVVLGSNGAGKSTLIKCLLGIIKDYSGKISTDVKTKYGYVPQSSNYSKSISLSGFDIVKSGLINNKKLFITKNDKENIKKVANLTGANKLLNEKFSILSGGEKQKILLTRALISNPDILVLDEPLTGIDTKSEIEFINLLEKIKDNGKTIILILHDYEPFSKILNKAIVLKSGKIVYSTNKISNTLHYKIFDSRNRHVHVERWQKK